METQKHPGRPRSFNDEEKRCSKCRVWFPLVNFNKDSSQPSGKESYCRACKSLKNGNRKLGYYSSLSPDKKKAYSLRFSYDISLEEYKDCWIRQNKACAICETALPLYGKSTHLDHDHVSGASRGILCGRCNWALGVLRDSIAGVEKALDYLKNPTFQRLDRGTQCQKQAC